MEGYGSIKVNVNTPNGQELFELKNMAYIPNFYINIMSYRRLRQAEYYWNNISLQIRQNNIFETFFYIDEIHN